MRERQSTPIGTVFPVHRRRVSKKLQQEGARSESIGSPQISAGTWWYDKRHQETESQTGKDKYCLNKSDIVCLMIFCINYDSTLLHRQKATRSACYQ